MVYSTSVVFRIAFGVVALVIVLSLASVPGGSFFARLNAASLVLIGLCLFAALYLDRWTFDKARNLFEKNIGILPLYWRKKRPLDSLQKVVLRESGAKASGRPTMLGIGPRGTALLYVVDRDNRVYRLDMVRGSSVGVVRKYAEMLSEFCAIPLEEDSEGVADGDSG